jgi:glycosyltransferase involved in cell wall biosynthesis
VTVQILNVSEADPPWNWLAHRFASDSLVWKACSTRVKASLSRLDRPLARLDKPFLGRMGATLTARKLIRKHAGRSVLVSHGPLLALYSEFLARPAARQALHLVFSFNFTDLPTGTRRALLRKHLRRVDRLVVASATERELYSEYFELEADRIDVLLWGVQPPVQELTKAARFSDGQYICAIGSQARDYDTLMDAMRRVPHINLILVATPDSLPRGVVPPNVKVLINIPPADAMNVLAHSMFMVLPLRDSTVPCGHVTVVAAMHMGKAILSTNSTGLSDYLIDGRNAKFFSPKNPQQLAEKIESLFNDPLLRQHLGTFASTFAKQHCSEDNTAAYFRRYLEQNGISV